MLPLPLGNSGIASSGNMWDGHSSSPQGVEPGNDFHLPHPHTGNLAPPTEDEVAHAWGVLRAKAVEDEKEVMNMWEAVGVYKEESAIVPQQAGEGGEDEEGAGVTQEVSPCLLCGITNSSNQVHCTASCLMATYNVLYLVTDMPSMQFV